MPSFLRPPAGKSDRDLDEWFSPGRFAVLLALFVLVMFPDVILGGRTFIFRDFGLFGYPLALHHRESFWHGEIPLWNPLSNCGTPFLAQWNTLVLYPGSLIYLLFPLEWSLAFFNLVHLFLCGFAMYTLAWNWTGSRRAATLAGLGFAFNGFTLNCLIWPNYIASLAWMPLVVLTVERAWRLGGRHLVLAALAGAMQMLSGTPEIILLTWLVLGALWLLHLWQNRSDRRRVIFRAGGVALLVAGLAAAQLLPFLDFLRSSHRDPGFAGDEWSMPITGWANFLVPLFRTTQSAAGVHFQVEQRITSSYYCGIGLAVFALMAAWRVRDSRVRLLAVLTGVCLVLALGERGWVYPMLLKIFPPAGLMRFPIKFVMLPAFLVPVLAAFGVREYLNAPLAERPRFWRSGLVLGTIFLVVIGLLLGVTWLHPAPGEIQRVTILNGLTRAVLLAATLGLWFVAGRDFELRRTWIVVLGLALLTWLDLATHAPRQNPTVERGVLRPGFPLTAQLQPRPAVGESRALLSMEAIFTHRLKVMTNLVNGHLLNRLTLYCNANLIDGLPKVDGFFALELPHERAVRFRLYPSTNTCHEALADFLSVSQFTSPTNLFAWTARPTFMPMATAGQKPIFLDETNTLAAMIGAEFNPRATVFLRPEDASRVTVNRQTSAKITSKNWSAQRIVLEVEATEPSLVVLSQTFYHPWRATVGGQPAPLLRANHAFQALEVPAGKHEIVLRYEDLMFRCGVGISGLTMVALVLLWLRGKQARVAA